MKFESAVPATAIEYGGVPCPCFPESKVSRGLRERQRERDGATYKDEERRLAAGQGGASTNGPYTGACLLIPLDPRESTERVKGPEREKVGRSSVGSTDSTRLGSSTASALAGEN